MARGRGVAIPIARADHYIINKRGLSGSFCSLAALRSAGGYDLAKHKNQKNQDGRTELIVHLFLLLVTFAWPGRHKIPSTISFSPAVSSPISYACCQNTVVMPSTTRTQPYITPCPHRTPASKLAVPPPATCFSATLPFFTSHGRIIPTNNRKTNDHLLRHHRRRPPLQTAVHEILPIILRSWWARPPWESSRTRCITSRIPPKPTKSMLYCP